MSVIIYLLTRFVVPSIVKIRYFLAYMFVQKSVFCIRMMITYYYHVSFWLEKAGKDDGLIVSFCAREDWTSIGVFKGCY